MILPNSFICILPHNAMNITQQHNFLDFPSFKPKILLCQPDLHPKDLLHVHIVNKEKFLDMYKLEWPLYVVKDRISGILLRLLAVIPLKITKDQILPFPFFIDTGTMYLGKKMKSTLEDLNVLHEIASYHGPYGIHGTFKWKNMILKDPVVNLLPNFHLPCLTMPMTLWVWLAPAYDLMGMASLSGLAPCGGDNPLKLALPTEAGLRPVLSLHMAKDLAPPIQTRALHNCSRQHGKVINRYKLYYC